MRRPHVTLQPCENELIAFPFPFQPTTRRLQCYGISTLCTATPSPQKNWRRSVCDSRLLIVYGNNVEQIKNNKGAD